MKLIGAVSEGSGAVNEDGFGWLGTPDNVQAAWVFDGVTGINGRNYLGEGTDARWLVARAHERLTGLAAHDIPLSALLEELVRGLIADFAAAAAVGTPALPLLGRILFGIGADADTVDRKVRALSATQRVIAKGI